MRPPAARHPFFWVTMLCAVILCGVFTATGIIVFRFGSLSRDAGWDYQFQEDGCYVTSVDPNGPADGKLQSGDKVLSIDGKISFVYIGMPAKRKVVVPVDHPYTIRVQQGSTQRDFHLDVIIRKDPGKLLSILALLLAAMIHGVISISVAMLRPNIKHIRLFAITGMSVALMQLAPVMQLMEGFFLPQHLKLGMLAFLFSFTPISAATAYHFFSSYPPDEKLPNPWAFLKIVLYVWAGALTAFFTFFRMAILLSPEGGTQFAVEHFDQFSVALKFMEPLMLLTFVAIIGVIFRNYRNITDRNHRRRIQWVVYSVMIGSLPYALYFLDRILSRWGFGKSPTSQDNLFIIANLFFVLTPITIAYTVLKHRMYDIQIVVRRGVHYIFAKGFLHILIYLPLALVIYTILRHPERRPLDLMLSQTSYLLLSITAVGGLLFRKNLLLLLDRKFFRERYNSEKILMTLVEEIKNFTSISEVAGWVSLQLDSALHPKRVLVFYKQKDGKLKLGYSSGEGRLDLPENSEILHIAESARKSQNLISSGQYVLSESDRHWLVQEAIHLLVPMVGPDDRVHGILLLGEKKSEEPYSAEDRKLLEALSGQMAMLYENLLLKEKVDQGQRIQREVLAHLSEQKRNLVKECPKCGGCFDSSEQTCNQDQTELELTLPVERTIDGKYRLDKLIGKGGMGAVYQAKDLRLSRDVAIKIMMGSMFGDPRALKRFEREAHASARVNHPNVITVFDAGGIGEGAYLVMELLHGYTMRNALQQKGNIPVNVALEWFNQIFEGMKAAHQAGIIHRDLKPENILITRDEKNQPLVKILDFGLAKMRLVDGLQSKTLTAPGTILGTLHYMSPEQITGAEVDERTDIFSLGVMLVEALTGRQPFTGNSTTEIAFAIIQLRFEIYSPELKPLNLFFQKCLAKKPEKRFSSIAEMQTEAIEAMRSCQDFAAPVAPPRDSESSPTDNIVF